MNKAISFTIDELKRDMQSPDFVTRWFAAEVVGTRRDLSHSDLEWLASEAPRSDVGEVICWGLGQMKYKKSVAVIAKFLEHQNIYYRWRAAEALRDLGNKPAVKMLIKYLNESEFSETRWRCAWALGEIRDMEGFRALWDHIEDEDRYVRWRSVWAISLLKGDVASKMKQILNRKITNNYCQWRAVWVLGRIGDMSTVKWLKKWAEDKRQISKYVAYQVQLATEAISKHYG